MMELNWDSIILVKKLKKQSMNLYQYVYKSCVSAAIICERIKDVFKEYTDHSCKHSYAVLKIGDELTKNIPLNKWEIAIFILSCYYHDIGMYITEAEKTDIVSKQSYKRMANFLIDQIVSNNQLSSNDPELVNEFVFIEYIRRIHAQRSSCWIHSNLSKENKDAYIDEVYLWDKVALISEAHAMELNKITDPLYSTDDHLANQSEEINMIFLACLLRLSDYCHMNQNRALPYIRLTKDFYSKKSEDIWRKLADVDYVSCDNKNHKIVVKASFDDYRLHRATIRECEDIDSELRNQLKWLSKQHSSYTYKVFYVDTERIVRKPSANYCDVSSSFKMDYSKVTRLLIGSKLYRDKLYALRECVQNGLDAITACKLKLNHMQGQIVIQVRASQEGNQIVEVFDNGTGMNKEIIDNYFLSIGSKSYWRTEDFNNDWGDINNASIIASHGIGVLSYFLIADKINVYSQYLNTSPIHVLIDGYEANVVYLSTDYSLLPKINIDSVVTPWEDGHGTCIQMYLKKSITPMQIVRFLLRNVLRATSKIDLIIYDKKYELQPRWHFYQMDEHNAWDTHQMSAHTDLNENQNIEDVFNEFYKNSDYFSNPPHDKGLKAEISLPGIKGFVYLTPYDSQIGENRITQNGILVEEASEYIDRFIPELFNINGSNIATYDLNIAGKNLFDLDAERVRILDSDMNNKIIELFKTPLIHSIIKCISQIENTLYFPCGQRWYHEISHTDMDNCQPAFHKSLNVFLKSLILLSDYERRLVFGAFGKAKLYSILQEKGNSAISAYEVIDNKAYALMIPKNKDYHVKNVFGFDKKRCTPDEILSFSQSHGLKAVMMPNHLDAFSFPLLDRLDLKIIADNRSFIGYSLRSSNDSRSYKKNLDRIYSDIAPKRNKSKFDLGQRNHDIEVMSSNTTLAEDIDLLNKYLREMKA